MRKPNCSEERKGSFIVLSWICLFILYVVTGLFFHIKYFAFGGVFITMAILATIILSIITYLWNDFDELSIEHFFEDEEE